MKTIQLLFFVIFCVIFSLHSENAVSPEMKKRLINEAVEASKNAYCPYSHYHVGAAILTKSGNIYSGCNIENASYSMTICAERTAAFKAVSEKDHDWVALALVTKDGGAPCGACRQVLNEFNPTLPIFIANEKGELINETPLTSLLTQAFGPANLR